jgi:hypothetical protein
MLEITLGIPIDNIILSFLCDNGYYNIVHIYRSSKNMN